VGPAYGGEGGGNSWVVHAHSRPRRGSRRCAISVDAQRGHEACAGNVTIPHAEHRLPISSGESEGHVKMPLATGTRAIACNSVRPTSDWKRDSRRMRALLQAGVRACILAAWKPEAANAMGRIAMLTSAALDA